MSSIPTNIPPVAISSQNNKNGRRNDARQLKVAHASSQKKRKNKKESEFPMGKEVFNDPYSLADEKYRLLVDISVLQNEVEPLRNELDHLKYFIKRTQDSHELKQAEQLESLDQEYDKLCVKYDNLDNLFSDVVLEQNQKHFEIMKQRQKVLTMELEDAEKALLSIETEFSQPKIAKYEKKYTENETKIANLKKLLKELKREEKDLNIKVTNSFAKSSSEDKNAELARLTNNYNSLKVTSLNKKHELEFKQKSFNARADRIRQVIQAKKNENDEKQERRQFNDKMKKKKEDHFLFDSYMKSDDMQNVREPEELQNNKQKNPRGKNHQQNDKGPNSDSSCSKARKTQKFILKIDTNMESSDHFDTDNFESFTSPCQSPVSTQNIEQNQQNSDTRNGLDGTKTFGTDDFSSTTEFSNSPRSNNNDSNNGNKANFSKSLQSELGSDEEGDLDSTSHLNETGKSTTSAFSDNTSQMKKCDSETENGQSETETERQSETGTEKQNETETEKQSETETEKQSETGTERQTETETEKQSETETEKQTETETEKQTETETEKQSETGTEKQSETDNETKSDFGNENDGGTHIKTKDQNKINDDVIENKKESSHESNDDDIISNSMAETESGVTPPNSPLVQ